MVVVFFDVAAGTHEKRRDGFDLKNPFVCHGGPSDEMLDKRPKIG